jgi:hypothetical protein
MQLNCMEKLLNLLVGLCCFSTVVGQTKPAVHPLVDSIYQQWQRKRVDSQRGTPKDSFYYLPTMPEEVLAHIKDWLAENRWVTQLKRINPFLFADTTDAEHIMLTQEEVDCITEQFHFVNQLPWPSGLFKDGKLVSMGAMDSLRRRTEAKQESIISTSAYQYHIFSVPILFRQNTLCLFFSGKADVLDHLGEWWLYRKEGAAWVPFGRVSIWWEAFMDEPPR